MAEFNENLAFNLFTTRNKAGRLSRKTNVKFGNILGGTKRRNTSNDAERGEATMSPVSHSNTAPDRLTTEPGVIGNDADQPDQVYNSQATTAGSPDLANGELRQRTSKTSADEQTTGGEQATREKSVKSEKNKFTVRNQLERTILNSWVNILLVAIPAGFAVRYANLSGIIVFVVNFLAIIPLAAMLSFATEEIALRTGETIGGLINATFGNAVELIVAVLALIEGKVVVVKTSLIGSILSNLLLVLGMCFFCGGFNRRVQYFNKTVAQTAASLLALAVASNIVPTVFKLRIDQDGTTPKETSDVASLSRGVSFILLVVYGAHLFFQLKTHSKVYQEESQKVPGKKVSKMLHRKSKEGVNNLARSSAATGAATGSQPKNMENGDYTLANLEPNSNTQHDDDDDEPDEPQLSLTVAIITLLVSTVIIAFCAEFMVGGIDALTASGNISVEFVGLILLPIVGNAAEHVTAVTVAIKDKMDLAIGVAVGSSMQVSLFLIPLLVIIGWGMGNEDMNLAFDTFQVAVLFVSVLLVNYLISDGESHWLEGFLLICLYLIIAVCSWWYPSSSTAE